MGSAAFLKQLAEVLTEYKALLARSSYDDLSDLPVHETQALVSKAVASINRIAGARSSYAAEAERILSKLPLLFQHLPPVMGVVQALHSDLSQGYVDSLVELAHADLFADFLEMAEHLVDANYKDAGAVIAGSALEAHLRALCVKHSLPTEIARANDGTAPKKADAINADLVTAGVYGKLDQKSVTAWLDLRNKAAHGHYTQYQVEQVRLLVASVREFIRRHPA